MTAAAAGAGRVELLTGVERVSGRLGSRTQWAHQMTTAAKAMAEAKLRANLS